MNEVVQHIDELTRQVVILQGRVDFYATLQHRILMLVLAIQVVAFVLQIMSLRNLRRLIKAHDDRHQLVTERFDLLEGTVYGRSR